jgi:hypothetical protein
MITVSYDFGVTFPSVAESAPGHRTFFSTTGLSNTWSLIPEFSGLNDAASLTATLVLGNWPPETDIYLLWVDDNSLTAPDGGIRSTILGSVAWCQRTQGRVSISPAILELK